VVAETGRRRNVKVQNRSRIKDRKLMFAAPIFDRQKAAGGARGLLTELALSNSSAPPILE
jgi:hypothetical protein